MKCPNCGFENPDSAEWCACGYDFQKKEMMKTPPYRLASWRVPVAFLIVVVTWFAWLFVAGIFMESGNMAAYLVINLLISLIGFNLFGRIVRKRWHLSVIMLLPVIFHYGQILIEVSKFTHTELLWSTIYTFIFVASSLFSAYAGSTVRKKEFKENKHIGNVTE